MRDIPKAGVRRFASRWWFWALALMVLPNCTLDRSGICCSTFVRPGPLPHSDAIMCDIEKFQGPTRRCATPDDLAMGIPLANAAEALVSGQTSNVGLDFSAAAQAACGAGIPQAIDFQGSFPDGFAVCLNCGSSIPVPHADAPAVCVAQCRDLINSDEGPTPADPMAFCTANARPSTNFPTSGCFENACSEGGTLRADFADPRRIQEPVIWTDLIGTAAVGSTLTRTLPTTPAGDLNAGAVSTQWITRGDAFVEFEAGDNTRTKIAGLSQVPGACPFPCTDSDPGITNLPFAISLNFAGRVFVVQNGAVPPGGTEPDGSWGTYAPSERFRVHVRDNNDGTGTVTYSRIVGACLPGNPCNEVVFHTAGAAAVYPLRVDTSFREQDGTLANVSIVRIQ